MAERRMFAKTIVTSDDFLDMPLSARCLYFTFGMFADDDGFVNNPKALMRQIGASHDDINILLLKRYIIPFESGVIVIRHWLVHNYIRKDTYNETACIEEKNLLELDGKNTYRLRSVDGSLTQDRIGKDSIGKVSIDNKEESSVSDDTALKRFVKPTVEEVRVYCEERGNNINAEQFVDFYESKGWKVGNVTMRDWKAAIRTWEKRNKQATVQPQPDGGDDWMKTLANL